MMDKSKTVNGIQVEAREWKKSGKHRLYFSAGRQGQACWDVANREWISVHGEFGARFKAAIKEAWGL